MKITITYRSHSANALLQEFADNHEEVELIVFPQNWTPEQCQDEVMRLKPWENGEWYTDETSRPEDVDLLKSNRLIKAIAKAVKRSFDLEDKSVWVEAFSAFQKRFDRVVLYNAKLDSHAPFSEMEDPTDILTKWLEEAGFEDISVERESPFRNNPGFGKAAELLSGVDRQGTLLLADRHDMALSETELPLGGVLLHVPLINLLTEGIEHMESFEINGIQEELEDIIFSDKPAFLA